MVWDIVKIGIEDVQKTFGITEDLYTAYVEGEIKKNADLIALIQKRDNEFDWQKETPLGGAGTTLNGCVLYCLIRHFGMISVVETGVSGGYYSAFILSALERHENDSWNNTQLTSLELSSNKEQVGKLVPQRLREPWALMVGRSSLDVFKDWESRGLKHAANLYCHDSLHTMSHMLKELNEFKKTKSEKFFVFIDDEKTDNFWQRCLQMGAFQLPGYSVKWISGAESRLNGHLGGFLHYVKD